MTNQKKRRFLSLLLTLLTACSLIAGTPLTAAGSQISARGSGNERAIPSQDIVILSPMMCIAVLMIISVTPDWLFTRGR